MKRVTNKESSNLRQWIENKFNDMHDYFRDKYTFIVKLVGSGKWNTIIKDDNGKWDLDYQIILTGNSSEFAKNGLKHATKIKQDFFNYFNHKLKYGSSIKTDADYGNDGIIFVFV